LFKLLDVIAGVKCPLMTSSLFGPNGTTLAVVEKIKCLQHGRISVWHYFDLACRLSCVCLHEMKIWSNYEGFHGRSKLKYESYPGL